MAIEKEKKFLLKEIPDDVLEEFCPTYKSIFQAYLVVTSDYEVRIRWVDDELTSKGYHTVKFGTGETRKELEHEIDENLAYGLVHNSNNMIRKERYICDRWEIDQYKDQLSGLFIAEIELHETELFTYDLVPQWLMDYIVADVTDDSTYKNKNLAFKKYENLS